MLHGDGTIGGLAAGKVTVSELPDIEYRWGKVGKTRKGGLQGNLAVFINCYCRLGTDFNGTHVGTLTGGGGDITGTVHYLDD